MKKLTLFILLIMPALVVFANEKEDSLIANIGKKAKVIFYAEKKADLDEIAKYDLNKLFAEVRKRSDKNFSNTEEVTLREADELKNRETNTTITPRKWLKNMNLNLFLGRSPVINTTTVIGPAYLLGSYVVRGIFNIYSRNTLMIGVGGFYDKVLFVKKRSELSLRYGVGFDLINTKLDLVQFGDVSAGDEKVYENFGIRSEKESDNILSTNLYAQLMPTLNLVNWKGQKTFSFAVGVKVASNFNNITFNEYLNDRRKSVFIKNSPAIRVMQPTLQTAFIANVGYKFVNLFIQVIPNHTLIESNAFSPTFQFEQANKQIKNTYTIGLRFGK